MYFDAHIHPVDVKTLTEASKMGVRYFICNSTHQNDWQKVCDLSESFAGVYPCIGIHPWFIETATSGWQAKMRNLLEQYPHAMVGEIGMDGTRPNLILQQKIFYDCLQIAHDLKRPVHIHGQKSWNNLALTLELFSGMKCLFHRFNGSEVQMKNLMACCDSYFSVMTKKPLLFLPPKRTLVETDSPDGAHFPAKIPHIVEKLNLDKELLYLNFKRFVGRFKPTMDSKKLLYEF